MMPICYTRPPLNGIQTYRHMVTYPCGTLSSYIIRHILKSARADTGILYRRNLSHHAELRLTLFLDYVSYA